MIEADHLSKRFGDSTVVDDATFTIPGGVLCGFVGPNGAGKTTTMRMLATLETPSSGTAYLNGAELCRGFASVRRAVGYMPDYCGTYPHLSVRDFLQFFARANGLFGARRRGRIDELVDVLELEDLLPQAVERVSKGQKQRLSLARALLPDPPILILDEPAAGLDPRSRTELYALLRVLALEGKTILVSSHILEELSEIIGWTVMIDAGRILYSGPLGALEERGPGGTPFALELSSDPDAALQLLAGEMAVLEVVRAGPRSLRLRLNETIAPPDLLLARLFAAGVRISQFKREQRKLRTLLAEVTERGRAARSTV